MITALSFETEAREAIYKKVKVFNNLDSALENGYTELLTWPVMDIALDLTAFASDCENEKPEDLIPHIQEWLNGHNKKA